MNTCMLVLTQTARDTALFFSLKEFAKLTAMSLHDQSLYDKQATLLSHTEGLESSLTDEERIRNTSGVDFLYLHPTHPVATFCSQISTSPRKLSARNNLAGNVSCNVTMTETRAQEQGIISVVYELPSQQPHVSTLLADVQVPKSVLTNRDLMEVQQALGKARGQKLVSAKTKVSDCEVSWGISMATSTTAPGMAAKDTKHTTPNRQMPSNKKRVKKVTQVNQKVSKTKWR